MRPNFIIFAAIITIHTVLLENSTATTEDAASSIAASTVMYSGKVFPGYYTNTMTYVGPGWVANQPSSTITGWDSSANTYLINGVATTLDQNGTGYNANNHKAYVGGTPAQGYNQLGDGIYYIGGRASTLDETGTGYNASDNLAYASGELAQGYNQLNDYTYYITGNSTTLNSQGTGYWNNFVYDQGSLATAGMDALHYTTGVSDKYTGIDWNLDYMYADNAYQYLWINGVFASAPWDALYNTGIGWSEYTNIYYIDYVATTLDPDGNGTWNGQNYVGGQMSN